MSLWDVLERTDWLDPGSGSCLRLRQGFEACVWHRGQSIKVFSQILRNARTRNFLVPNMKVLPARWASTQAPHFKCCMLSSSFLLIVRFIYSTLTHARVPQNPDFAISLPGLFQIRTDCPVVVQSFCCSRNGECAIPTALGWLLQTTVSGHTEAQEAARLVPSNTRDWQLKCRWPAHNDSVPVQKPTNAYGLNSTR